MAQSRSVGTLVYPVEAGNAGTIYTHVLDRGPAGVRSPADRMFNP